MIILVGIITVILFFGFVSVESVLLEQNEILKKSKKRGKRGTK